MGLVQRLGPDFNQLPEEKGKPKHPGKEGVILIEKADDRQAQGRLEKSLGGRYPHQPDKAEHVQRDQAGCHQLDAASTAFCIQVGGGGKGCARHKCREVAPGEFARQGVCRERKGRR